MNDPSIKNMYQIKGAQLLNVIDGSFLLPDPDSGQVHFEYSEHFYKSKIWESVRNERSQKTLRGTWRISDRDEICVSVDGSEYCRKLWKNKENGKILFSDLGSGPLRENLIYILVK